MENLSTQHSNYSVYPGIFVPLANEHNLKVEIHDSEPFNPSAVQLTESENLIKVEVAMPGTNRESILLYADKNILSISVLQIESFGKTASHRANSYTCFEKDIELPGNVDAEFVSAEYQSGILKVNLVKATNSEPNIYRRIVVY